MEKAHNLINIKKLKMSNYTSIIDHIFRKHRQYKNQNINSEKLVFISSVRFTASEIDSFSFKRTPGKALFFESLWVGVNILTPLFDLSNVKINNSTAKFCVGFNCIF